MVKLAIPVCFGIGLFILFAFLHLSLAQKIATKGANATTDKLNLTGKFNETLRKTLVRHVGHPKHSTFKCVTCASGKSQYCAIIPKYGCKVDASKLQEFNHEKDCNTYCKNKTKPKNKVRCFHCIKSTGECDRSDTRTPGCAGDGLYSRKKNCSPTCTKKKNKKKNKKVKCFHCNKKTGSCEKAKTLTTKCKGGSYRSKDKCSPTCKKRCYRCFKDKKEKKKNNGKKCKMVPRNNCVNGYFASEDKCSKKCDPVTLPPNRKRKKCHRCFNNNKEKNANKGKKCKMVRRIKCEKSYHSSEKKCGKTCVVPPTGRRVTVPPIIKDCYFVKKNCKSQKQLFCDNKYSYGSKPACGAARKICWSLDDFCEDQHDVGTPVCASQRNSFLVKQDCLTTLKKQG